jgi:hypothetical protein
MEHTGITQLLQDEALKAAVLGAGGFTLKKLAARVHCSPKITLHSNVPGNGAKPLSAAHVGQLTAIYRSVLTRHQELVEAFDPVEDMVTYFDTVRNGAPKDEAGEIFLITLSVSGVVCAFMAGQVNEEARMAVIWYLCAASDHADTRVQKVLSCRTRRQARSYMAQLARTAVNYLRGRVDFIAMEVAKSRPGKKVSARLRHYAAIERELRQMNSRRRGTPNDGYRIYIADVEYLTPEYGEAEIRTSHPYDLCLIPLVELAAEEMRDKKIQRDQLLHIVACMYDEYASIYEPGSEAHTRTLNSSRALLARYRKQWEPVVRLRLLEDYVDRGPKDDGPQKPGACVQAVAALQRQLIPGRIFRPHRN